MKVNQDEIFAAFEGNRWFERNKAALEQFDAEADLPLQLMSLYSLRPDSVLEVGAANGYRLAAIFDRYGVRVVAAEPSDEAIRHGKASFPAVEFVQCSAHAVPLQEFFDLIIVNSVFHWIDRTTLLRCVAEVDRLLADGGYLIIGDFYPSNLVKVRYHHLADHVIYSYKQNYAAMFLASGLYHLVCLLAGEHGTSALTAEATEGNRWGASMLRKTLNERYIEASSPHLK